MKNVFSPNYLYQVMKEMIIQQSNKILQYFYFDSISSSITPIDHFCILLEEDYELSYLNYVIKNSNQLICDLIDLLKSNLSQEIKGKMLYCLSLILTGRNTNYYNPSIKSSDLNLNKFYSDVRNFSSEMFQINKNQIYGFLNFLALSWIYEPKDLTIFLPLNFTGYSLIVILIKFITELVETNGFNIINVMKSACKSSKISWGLFPWESWLNIFMIGISEGAIGLVKFLKSNYEKFTEESFEYSECIINQANYQTRYYFSIFISALLRKIPSFLIYMVENEYHFRRIINLSFANKININ